MSGEQPHYHKPASLYCHFGKYLWLEDVDKYRASLRKSVDALSGRFLEARPAGVDPNATVERSRR